MDYIYHNYATLKVLIEGAFKPCNLLAHPPIENTYWTDVGDGLKHALHISAEFPDRLFKIMFSDGSGYTRVEFLLFQGQVLRIEDESVLLAKLDIDFSCDHQWATLSEHRQVLSTGEVSRVSRRVACRKCRRQIQLKYDDMRSDDGILTDLATYTGDFSEAEGDGWYHETHADGSEF